MIRNMIVGAVVCAMTLGAASVASAQFPQQPQRFPQPFPQFPQQPFPQFPQFPQQPRFPQPGRLPPPVEAHYHVMYRTCSHAPWRCFGTYDCHQEAHRIECLLERRGYEARVDHH